MLADATSVGADRTEVVSPPRLNFTGICLHCGERDCEADACVAWHARSRWMVCPDCDGAGWTELLFPCGCVFGLAETRPVRLDANEFAAV